MRSWTRLLVPLLLLLLAAQPVSAASGGNPLGSISIQPIFRTPNIPVAFSAVPNRYTDVVPSTNFDLNGDLTGDVQISNTTVTGKNGTTVQMIDPPALSLDLVQVVPGGNYTPTAATQLSRVYVAKLPDGGYAKFMLLQASPKVTIWFSYGKPTTSTLIADGTGGHAVLTWTALSDAALGYNIYRYAFLDDNAYTVTLLNDFTVQTTGFTDDTAENQYYLYVVVAIKAGGAFGSSTTVAAVQVQSQLRKLVIALATGTASLDGTPVTLDSPPVIKNGRLMVPATVLTNVGVKVTYDAVGNQITLVRKLESVTYTLTMSTETADYTWNASTYKADVPPYLTGSVVMVPVRIVAPSLGYGLDFNSTERKATVQWFE